MSDQTGISNREGERAELSAAFFDHFDVMPFHQYLGLKVHQAEKNRATLRLHRNDETPTTGRMNPEYDYLFKLLVRARARDDVMCAGCVRSVSGWIIHSFIGHARVPLRSCTGNARARGCVCTKRISIASVDGGGRTHAS